LEKSKTRQGNADAAQKWLNDRMGKKLDFADIHQYQNIIAILTEPIG